MEDIKSESKKSSSTITINTEKNCFKDKNKLIEKLKNNLDGESIKNLFIKKSNSH